VLLCYREEESEINCHQHTRQVELFLGLTIGLSVGLGMCCGGGWGGGLSVGIAMCFPIL